MEKNYSSEWKFVWRCLLYQSLTYINKKIIILTLNLGQSGEAKNATCFITLTILNGLSPKFNHVYSTLFSRAVLKIIMIDQMLLFLKNIQIKLLFKKIIPIFYMFACKIWIFFNDLKKSIDSM